MADFCRQCSEDMFGQDFKELAGLTNPDRWVEGYAAVPICEGCGPIQVDPEGRCVSGDCLKKHACPHCTPEATCKFHRVDA